MPELSLTLPLPPSVNHLYDDVVYWRGGRRVRGKALSDAGREFRLQVKSAVCHCRPIGRAARVHLSVRFYVPRRRQDGDNLCKALQDSLAWALDFDDAQIAELHVYVERNGSPPHADVRLLWGDEAIPSACAWCEQVAAHETAGICQYHKELALAVARCRVGH